MASNRAAMRSSRNTRATRVPRDQMAQAREGQVELVLSACERMLRPLIRLALAFGVKHAQLEEVLRDAMLEEARRAWQAQGVEPNVSQLSVTTGLNRKALASKVRRAAEALPQSETSAAAKALTLWLQLYADDPTQHALPITSSDEASPSFEAMARHASRGNVHHRAILDELVRLNMATERDGVAELAVESFVPAGDLKSLLSFLGDNARDHLLAGVSNTLGTTPALLEQSVYATGVSLAQCERIHQLARDRWAVLQREMSREMRKAFDAAAKEDAGRIRVGIYTYFEDEGSHLDLARPGAQNRRSQGPATGPRPGADVPPPARKGGRQRRR